MEVLDVLRSLRQRHDRLRMVFTGSVGLHQVIKALRSNRYANDPANDMMLVEVSPLQPDDGTRLAALLIEGEQIHLASDPGGLARDLSEGARHIPYHIQFL